MKTYVVDWSQMVTEMHLTQSRLILTAFAIAQSSMMIWCGGTASAKPADTAAEFRKTIKPLLQEYCYDCHGDGSKEGDISLDQLSDHSNGHELWLRVWKNLRSQLMPPPHKRNQPAQAERQELVTWIEKRVFQLDPDNPDPGRVTIRRLNREEYRNTIEDLMGVSFSVSDNFPADDTGFGFDNIGDVLTLSPLLMEKYLAAAEEIAALAMPEDAGKPKPIEIAAGSFRDRRGDQTARFMEADTVHSVWADRAIPVAGSFLLEAAFVVENQNGRPRGQRAIWRVLVDGKELRRFDIDSDSRTAEQIEVELDLEKGSHRFEFSIESTEPGTGSGTAGVRVTRFRLNQQHAGGWHLYPSSYKRLFFKGLPPADEDGQAAYMREIIERFVSQAFRRPPLAGTVDQLTALALAKAQKDTMKFVDGVKLAVTATLASPRFLFRGESQVEPDNPNRVVPVDEFALASRLSYFLWTSAPDAELLELAGKKELRANLRQQITRMLADEKVERFVQNFVGQWLQARDLPGLNIDVRRILRERSRRRAAQIFNEGIRRDMRTETEMFFRHVLVENRPILELLNADYSFLNQDLARFYQIPNVTGDEFRKVVFDDHARGRGGLLGQGTFLLVTSQPTRTSPVKRGLFVLENILGTPPPPAPPDVPELREAKEKADQGATMRQLMEVHRQAALCRSCHQRMDPIGLALENFNAIGQWRNEVDGRKIDSAGELVTGERFSNVAELKEILANSRKVDFYRCLTEKILTYALGRGIEFYDTPTVDAIVNRLLQSADGLKELVTAVIESVPFQKRRGDGSRLHRAAIAN